MMATSQMEAIALAISAVMGGGKKNDFVNKEAPTSAAALQHGLSAFMNGSL